MKWLEQSNILTRTWFSSTQSSFIPKFLVDFCDKIRRVQTALARSKMYEAQNFLKKKSESFIGERFHISFSYIRKVLTRDLVNGKYNNYNKRFLSCIRLSKIRFSLLQLGHYQDGKSPFWKTYLTSYLICNLHKFNNFK